jgi:hypothetical protein
MTMKGTFISGRDACVQGFMLECVGRRVKSLGFR